QIAGGKFTIAAGQSADLDIDFNACASIVKAGASGKFLLKPVLHAGEASVNNATIGGTVVDSATGSGIMGAMVLLEQPRRSPGLRNLWIKSSTQLRRMRAGISSSVLYREHQEPRR